MITFVAAAGGALSLAAALGVLAYLRRKAPWDMSGAAQILAQALLTVATLGMGFAGTAYLARPAAANEPSAEVSFNDLQNQDVAPRCVTLRGTSRLDSDQAVIVGIVWLSGRSGERWYWTSDLAYNTARTSWSVDLVLGQERYLADAAHFQVRAAVVPRELAEYLASASVNAEADDTSWSSPMDLPQTVAITDPITVIKGQEPGTCAGGT